MFFNTPHIERKTYRPFGILALGLVFTCSAAMAEDPKTAPDDSWISVSGTVTDVDPNSFVLDYGEDTITVEMDDGDRDADAYKLVFGDKVTVSGRIDDDLFETRTIEAGSVYVENLNTTFYASPVDDEDYRVYTSPTISYPVYVSETVVEGTITGIAGDEEFVLYTGGDGIMVETDALPYDPLDDEGYQQLDIGDRVRVRGWMDNDFLEGRELVARSIVTLAD